MFFSRKGKGLLFPTLLASILHSSSFVLVRSPFQSSSPIWANPRKEAFGGGGAKESLPPWGGAKKGKGEEGLLGTTGRSVGLAGQEEEEERRDPNVQDGPKDGGGGEKEVPFPPLVLWRWRPVTSASLLEISLRRPKARRQASPPDLTLVFNWRERERDAFFRGGVGRQQIIILLAGTFDW